MSEHYRRHNIEAIDVINDWDLNFNLGNVVKLVSRLNYKNEGKDKHRDIKKAIDYLRYEIYYDIAKASAEAQKKQIDPNKRQYNPILRYDDDDEKLRGLRGGM